jgi:hypothetical protein
MATKKLTEKHKRTLLGVLNNPHWPNECRFEEAETYTTRGGNLGCRKYDRRANEGLFDAGLLEAVRAEGYTYRADWPAAGILRVTEKGKAAIESGRYEHTPKPRAKVERPEGFAPNRSPFADLPRIIYVEGIHDGGPMEDGGTFCPHCGAEGRYVYHFVCEGGVRAACMRGCFKMWPKHQFAELAARLLDKEREYAERSKKSGREWKLCSWDREMMDAIERFANGSMTEGEAAQVIRDAKARAKAWRERRRTSRAY